MSTQDIINCWETGVEPYNATDKAREVTLTWSDGQTTPTSREVLNKFKAIYGENPKCKIT